jgi:hypothetical protein
VDTFKLKAKEEEEEDKEEKRIDTKTSLNRVALFKT